MGEYYYGIWFVGNGKSMDWLGQLLKENGKWAFKYRFRYYDAEDPGNDPFSNKDRKRGYIVNAVDDSIAELNRLLPMIHLVVGEVERQFKAKADFVDLKCCNDEPKFLFELGSRDWANIRLETEEPK